MPTPAELLHSNLYEVFNNRDAESRRAAIMRTYTDDVRFADNDGVIVGREALHQRVGELLAGFPSEFEFTEVTPSYIDDDLAALGWELGPSGGEPVARGLDLLTITDGLVSEVRTIVVQ